jgi:hypothetical protein
MNMRRNKRKVETMDRRRWCYGEILGSLSLLGGIASVPAIGPISQPRSGVPRQPAWPYSGFPAGRCRQFVFFPHFADYFLIMTNDVQSNRSLNLSCYFSLSTGKGFILSTQKASQVDSDQEANPSQEAVI